MRAVIQRVSSASVTIDGQTVAAIGPGLLMLLGIEDGDGDRTTSPGWRRKSPACGFSRTMPGQMNLSLIDTGGDALVVSQFTLHALTRKGNRPSFIRAARPDALRTAVRGISAWPSNPCSAVPVARGRFAADMKVALINDGPVTIIIDSKSRE